MENILLHRLAYALVHKFQITVPEGQLPDEFEDSHLDQIRSYAMSLNDRQLGQIFAGLNDVIIRKVHYEYEPGIIQGRNFMRQIITYQIIERMCSLLGPSFNQVLAYEDAEADMDTYFRSREEQDD